MLTACSPSAGYRLRRVCDKDGQCFDGWPYTQNDGFLGQAAQNSSFTDADSVAVRDAVLKMQNPKQFSASYGHAFIRCGTSHTLHRQHRVLLCLQLCAAQGAAMPEVAWPSSDLLTWVHTVLNSQLNPRAG